MESMNASDNPKLGAAWKIAGDLMEVLLERVATWEDESSIPDAIEQAVCIVLRMAMTGYGRSSSAQAEYITAVIDDLQRLRDAIRALPETPSGNA